MPYTEASQLPATVRDALPAEAQRQFLEVFNAAMGDGKNEEQAFEMAWGVIRQHWDKPEGGGTWIAKAADFGLVVKITKRDDERRTIYGWAYVAKDNDGHYIVDHHGDVIPIDELRDAAEDFVLHSRQAGVMHVKKRGIGELVESMVFTEEKIAALGLAKGAMPEGWFVGFRISDDDAWGKVKAGDYPELSIGGKAIREALPVRA